MPAYLVELEDGKKYRVESDTPPTEQDIAEYLGGAAPVAKDEPLFDLSDTLSAAGQAVKGLPTTAPHAFRQLYEGLDNPWKRGEGYLKSQETVDAYQQELEAANLEAEKSGDISIFSRGMRQAGQSLGFSAGAMGAGLVTSTPSAAAGRAIGGLAGPKGAVAGEIIGRGAGALAAGYGAAYRMAGAQFLDDARKEIDAKFLSTVGRPPNEQEQEEAYQELLPLAQAFGNAEAGPEAIGNLAMAGAGKYVFGLGRKTIEKLAASALGKTGAVAGALATELGGETVTGVEQNRIEAQKQAMYRSEQPEETPRTMDEYVTSLKEVAPATLATMGLMSVPPATVKAVQAVRGKPAEEQPAPDTDFARRAAMEGATEFRDTTAGAPVVVEGITIATIPPGSDLSPDDVAAFVGMPDGPAVLKRYADQGRIVLPEIVKPVENVDPALTDEMNQNIAAGAANAPATVEELKKAQALYEAQTLARERQAAEETLRVSIDEALRSGRPFTPEEQAFMRGQPPSAQTPTPAPATSPGTAFDSRNTEMLPDEDNFGGKFDQLLRIKPDSYVNKDGIETVEYTNPDTGVVDAYISAFGNNDFIAYMRVYDENGNPTNRFTSKLERRTNRPGATRAMIEELQSRLPSGHQYAEDVSVSTDGLRFITNQLNQGYSVATNSDGTPITTEVAISGESITNDLPIAVDPNGKFENIRVRTPAEFAKVKEFLGKKLEAFGVGLNASNVRWENGTAYIDLPVLQRQAQRLAEEREPVFQQRDDGTVEGVFRTPEERSQWIAANRDKISNTTEVDSGGTFYLRFREKTAGGEARERQRRQAAEETLRQQEAERAAAEQQETLRQQEVEQTAAREAEERRKRYEAMRAEQSVKLDLTPDESGATGAGMKEEIQQTPISREIAEEDRAEFEELQDLMTRRGQAQNKVKGVKFSTKDEARFQELGAKLRGYLFKTVDPETDELLGINDRDEPVYWSDNAKTHYSISKGEVRTGPWVEGLSESALDRLTGLLEQPFRKEPTPAPQPITPLNDPLAPRVFRENSEALNRSQSIPVDREEAVDLIYSKVTQADRRQEDGRFGPDPFDPGSGPSTGFITDNVGEMSQSLRRRAVEGDRILPEEARQLWNEREVIRYAWGQEFNSSNRRTRSNWREGWTALHEPYDAPKSSGPGDLDAFYDVLSADEFLESEGLSKPPPPQPIKPKPAPQPITPTGETPTDSLPADKPTSGDVGTGAAVQRDPSKPEQMTPDEATERVWPGYKNVQSAPKEGEAVLNGMPAKKKGGWVFTHPTQGLTPVTSPSEIHRLDHQLIVRAALTDRKPVSVDTVDWYDIKLPEGYVRQGELYVYRPSGTVDAKPAAEVETPVAVPETGMQRRQQALDAGLDRRTADAVGAFTDIASMMREVQNRTPEQIKKDWIGYLEEDLEKFKGSAPRKAPESSLFADGQYVRYERQKNGGFKVVADEATWSPPGEKTNPQFKKGKVIREFPNVDALFNYVRGESAQTPAVEAPTPKPTPPAKPGQRDSSKPEQMTPEELSSFQKSESIRAARVALDRAKSGRDTPNVFTNGFKSKAAMVRAKEADLESAMTSSVKPDVWQVAIDAANDKRPVYAGLVESLSDVDQVFGTGPAGEPGAVAPSPRKQLIENLTSKGYVRQGELYVFQPTVTTATETPIDAANVDGGSQGVQTESAEGSIPAVTEDTVSISDIPSTAETSSQQFTSDTIEDTLTSAEKSEAATELGHSSWGKEALEDFKARLADWLVTGKTVSKKLAAIFKRLVNSAKALAVAGLSAISVNTGDARVTAESGNAPVQPVAFRAVLNDMPAPKFRFPAGLPQSRPLPQAQQRGVLLPRPRTPRVADFGNVRAPAEVVNTANWVVDNDDTQGRPFVIADKKRGWVYVFNADGSLEGRNPAIFGKDTGDTRKKGTRVTPSGRFEATVDPDAGPLYGTTVDFMETEESVLAIHRVYLPEAKERRRALESKGGADNRMSHGCINVEDTFYDDTLQPLFNESGGVVYILPETKSGAKPSSPRSPAENLVSFTAANGQKLVGEVQSVTGNKATVAYQWNGKTKTQVVPVSQLGSPVASVATPPKYQYNQEQNTRKLGKHFPTALGVHANHDFRKSFASMAKDTALGQDYQMIARMLSKMPEFKDMDLHLVADENIKYAGEYSWNNGKPSIAINLRLIARGQVDALGSILHEALHHVTLAKVRNPQGAFENEVVSNLDLIRESVREYAESKGFGERLDYELGSTEEFITALFTRPDFQALIASIPDSAAPGVAVGKFRSLLSEIFRLIAELVHGKPVLRGSALEQAMTTSLALFNTPFRAIETGGLEALNAARSYAGERAQMPQFMRDSLETAQAMAAAGKTSEEIRAVTGWFPGKYDGKMRWEIPDEGATVDKEYLKEFANGERSSITLGRLLDHAALYGAYPEASELDVEYDEFLKSGGAFQGDTIYFGPNTTRVGSILLHEVQHWIQEKEGFAKGGDSRMAFADPRMGIGSKEGIRAANKILRVILNNMKTPMSIEDFAKRAWDSDTISDEIKESYSDYRKSFLKASNDPNNIRLAQQAAGKEWYRRLAGEIEARDVQARQRFTPEQRKAVAPYSSENIAKEDAIVMFGGSGAQASRGKGIKALFPQTGVKALFPQTGTKPINLSAAYQKAVTGKSSQWVTIKEVYEQAKADNPSLTPEAFMQFVQQQNDAGGVMISPVENVSTVEAAQPFVIGNAGVEMIVPSGTAASRADEETDAEYMAAVEAGDMETAQRMVDEAARAAGYDVEGWHYSGEKFTEFDISTARTSSDIQGFFFKDTRDKDKEYGPIEYKVALKLKNPANRAALMSGFSPGSTNDAGVKQREKLIKQGYDGAIISREEGEMDYAEIIVFNPSQIKSADPVTYDSSGAPIPLSQRFNPESPSILYAAPIDISTLPTREPASGENVPDREAGSRKNAETVSQRLESRREEAISAAVAENDWGNYTREQKVAAAESFLAKWVVSFSAMEFPADVRFSVEAGDGSGAHVSVHEVPSRPLGIRVSVGQNRGFDKYANLSPTEVFAHLYDTAQEESIHVAQYLGMHRDWLAAREQGFKGTFLSYLGQKLKATFAQVNKARIDLQQTDPAAAEKIRDAMLASWNIYHFNDRVEGIAGLWSRLEGDPSRQGDFIMEMVRQLTQLKRQDFTTETGWQKFTRVLKQWLTDAINALRGVQDVFRSGMAGDLIQRQLADLEAALDGKPLPPVSRPAASRADDGEGVIDIGGEAEPADGGGTQLFKKRETAIGTTFITPADITLQERRSQEETLAKARKIIAEEVQKDEKGGRAVALQRFKSDLSIPPEVRAAGTGLIAQQADLLANLERDAIKQEGLDALADEAGKVSGIIGSDLEYWRNLQLAANLDIDKMAEEAGRTLNIFNVFRRLTPEGFLRRMKRQYNATVQESMAQNFDIPPGEVEAKVRKATSEKTADPEKAIKDLIKSLKPKPRAPREKIEKALKALFAAAETGALDSQEFFDTLGEALGHPPLTPAQQEKIKKLTREINALPKGAARVDKQQELDEELALWKGIAARDVLLSAWYANILSGISTQGIGLFGNLANFLPRSLFLAATNPRSARAYFQGAFGEGLKTGLKEARAAMQGRGLYKVSKYGDKNMVSALELLRKKGPATLPEWIAYIASAGTNLRYVFRVMQAIDALAWNTAREGQAYLAAHRALLDQQRAGANRSPEEFSRALIENLGGDAKQIEEDMRAARDSLIALGQTPDLLTVDRMAREARNARRTFTKPSNRFADRIVMQQDPEGIGDVISSIITVIQKKGNFMGVPFGQLLIPFNKIVANLFEQSLDYTPVGALRSYFGGHLTDIQSIDWSGKVQFKDKSVQFDAVERAERMAASVTGTLAASVMFALASLFKDEPDEDVPFMLYGFGPESKSKRDQMPKGWTPYSAKIGDTYIKFSEMPFGVMFAAAGNALDAMRYKNMDKKSSAERLAYVLKTSAKGFTEQGVLSSFDTALEVLTFQASDKKFTDVPVNVAKGMVPAQGMLRDLSVLFDPVKIKDDTISAALLRDFPVVRRIGTRPALNVFGEPMTFDGRIPFVRRIATLREKHPVADYLGRNGLSIPGMAQTIVVGQYLPKDMKDRIQRRALQTSAMENGVFTVEQDYNFRKRAGELTKAAVESLLTQVPTITSDRQRENVQNLINRKVEIARRRAMLEAVPAQ